MASVIAPITRYFGHKVHIHVQIFREADARRLNLECGMRAWPGIEWDRPSKKLVISGVDLDDADRNAVEFYEYMRAQGYRKICARVKHRMGRNGHGWPLDKEQKAAAENARRIMSEILRD